MKPSKFIGFVFLSAAFIVGCGGGGDALIKEQISIMHETAALMEGVTDVNSMAAAAPKISNLKKRLDEVLAKLNNLPPETRMAINERYVAELKAAVERSSKATKAATMKVIPGSSLKVPDVP